MWMIYYRYRFVVALGTYPLVRPCPSLYLFFWNLVFDFEFSESLSGCQCVALYICSHLAYMSLIYQDIRLPA